MAVEPAKQFSVKAFQKHDNAYSSTLSKMLRRTTVSVLFPVPLNMEFEEKKLMCEIDDPLRPIFLTTIGLLRNRYMRVMLGNSLIIHWTKNFFQLYIFMSNPDELVQFMPFFLGEIYALTSGTALLITWSTLEQFTTTKFKRWTIDSAGPKIEEQVNKWTKQHLTMIYGILTLGLVTGLLVLYPDPSDGEFIFLVYYIEKTHPGSRKWFPYLYKISMGPLGVALIVHPFLIMYGAVHAYFQAVMLVEHVKNLTWDYENDEEDSLVDNKEFQETVHRRLIFIIRRHVELIGTQDEVNKIIFEPLFPIYAISAYCFGLSLIMFYLGVDNELYAATIRNLVVGALFGSIVGVTFWGFISSGQLVENMNDEGLDTLQSSKWYVWNKNNKSTFCIFMHGLSKPTRFSFTDEVSVNYELGVQIIKGVYSVVSVVSMIQK